MPAWGSKPQARDSNRLWPTGDEQSAVPVSPRERTSAGRGGFNRRWPTSFTTLTGTLPKKPVDILLKTQYTIAHPRISNDGEPCGTDRTMRSIRVLRRN